MSKPSSVINGLSTIVPSPKLREFVSSYVVRDVSIPFGRVCTPVSIEPDLQLTFILGDPAESWIYSTRLLSPLPPMLVVGPRTRATGDLLVQGHYVEFSIRFQPAGAYRLLGLPGSALVDSGADAREVLGPSVENLFERLRTAVDIAAMVSYAEEFLTAKIVAAKAIHAVHRAALTLRHGGGPTSLDRVVRDTGYSVRHFDRAFLAQLGMSPKRYARVARLGLAVQLKLAQPQRTWAYISQDAGFFDQTHLVKDFRLIVAAAPSAYIRVLQSTPQALRTGSFGSGAMSSPY